MKRATLFYSIALSCWLAAAAVAGEPAETAPAPELTAAALTPDTPVAEVNGRVIPYRRFAIAARQVMGKLRGGGMHDQVGLESETMRKEVLGELVRRELLAQEALKTAAADLDQRTDERLAAAKAQFSSPEAFARMLTAESLTEGEFRTLLREDIAIGAYIEERLVPQVQVTEAEVQKYYDANKERQYEVPERLDLSHILIFPGADEGKEAAALAEAQEVRQRVVGGEDFEAVAREVSRDPLSRDAGGHLGPRTRAELPPEVADACWGLPAGGVSEVVRTRFGYHVLRVEGRLPPSSVSFEEAQAGIDEQLRDARLATLLERTCADLASKGEIRILLPHGPAK